MRSSTGGHTTGSEEPALRPIELPGVSWATFTRHGRLVFARGGALSSGEVIDGRLEETPIADFSAERPEPKAWTGETE